MKLLRRIPILVWFLIPTLIIVGIGVWFFSKGSGGVSDSDKPVPVAHPVAGTREFPIIGRNHIPAGTVQQGYNSNPPTSGPHWDGPSKNGVFDKELPDEQLIHNLEHGYVWVSYKNSVSDEVKNKLREVVTKDDWKVILEPRDKNDSRVALVAWGRLLNMDDFNAKTVEDFIKTYRNRGPEKTPE